MPPQRGLTALSAASQRDPRCIPDQAPGPRTVRPGSPLASRRFQMNSWPMEDQMDQGVVMFAVMTLGGVWYANRIRHPEREMPCKNGYMYWWRSLLIPRFSRSN